MVAATKLQLVRDNWETHARTLDEALLNNRKLWTVLLTSTLNEENEVAAEIKNNIANIANFIFSHTMRVMLEKKPEQLDTLISINRNIAAGLRGIAADEPAAA